MPQNIGYIFPEKIQIISIRLINGQSSSWTGRMPGTFRLKYSNDGNLWYTEAQFSKSGGYYQETFNTNIIANENNCHQYWRLYIVSSCTGDNYMNISGIDFYGYKIK